jgi:hypothetical protein
MTDQPPVDLTSLVATLLQQQSAMLQQQTALLQVHGESVRLQRVLLERLLGNVSDAAIARPATTSPPPVLEVPTTPAPQVVPVVPLKRADGSTNEHADIPPPPAVTPALASLPVVDDQPERRVAIDAGDRGNAAYAARYYRAPPAASFTPVEPQDLELLRRLREIPEASGLILQFGPHKGEKLGQVAASNPDYIRQLVIRAQRPEVRAAAARLIEAIDAAAEHKRRTSRSSSRRSRASA